MGMSLGKLWETVKDREAAIHGTAESDVTEQLNTSTKLYLLHKRQSLGGKGSLTLLN